MINIQKPPVDITEDSEKFYIAVDLPGVFPEDLEILASEQSIEIKGIKKSSLKGKFIVMERHYGVFQRKIYFKEFLNIEKSTAYLQNGVLFIEIPKAKNEFYLKSSMKIIIRR
ncbi:MAG: Hsp20/alpha crystallin family protein [Aquificae bacterium]|nr:Hsp20/alpha crystallin family protein [Aquificota bacterium]